MPSLVVIAAPATHRTRVGAKFELTHATLRIGPSRDARIVIVGVGNDLELSSTGNDVTLRTKGRPIKAWLAGRPVGDDAALTLQPHDVLFVEPGWAFTLAPAPKPSDFSSDIEASLAANSNDVQAWSVYADWLLERGTPLGAWLRGQHDGADARAKFVGRLAEPINRDALRVTWSHRHVIDSVRLTRAGLAGLGAWWLLRALAEEPAFRFVERLSVEAFLGSVTPVMNDDAASELVSAVGSLPCAPFLRHFTLGYLHAPAALPRTTEALAQLVSKTPHQRDAVINVGPHATLELRALPPGIVVAGLAVGERRRLGLGRTELGADATAHVRFVGPGVAQRVCVVANAGGTFSVGEAQHDQTVVNGRAIRNAALLPGDVLEPVPGLLLAFEAGVG